MLDPLIHNVKRDEQPREPDDTMTRPEKLNTIEGEMSTLQLIFDWFMDEENDQTNKQKFQILDGCDDIADIREIIQTTTAWKQLHCVFWNKPMTGLNFIGIEI